MVRILIDQSTLIKYWIFGNIAARGEKR